MIKTTYNFKSISLVPNTLTSIKNYNEIDPCVEHENKKCLPVFLNAMDYEESKNILSCQLRPFIYHIHGEDLETKLNDSEYEFVYLDLNEAEEFADYEDTGFEKRHIIINGYEGKTLLALEICNKLKANYGKRIEIIYYGVINPMVYTKLCEYCIDWVICADIFITYGKATLITELMEEKEKFIKFDKNCECSYTKILIEFNINDMHDGYKAIAMGADGILLNTDPTVPHDFNMIYEHCYSDLMTYMMLTDSRTIEEFKNSEVVIVK